MILALGTAPAFFTEVVALLVASALVAYVCHRLRIMPIVSFLVAGALIGPQALGLVRDQALIEAAAEIGVMLLLFTIGIELSLGRLARIRRLVFVGGGIQVISTLLVVAGLLGLAGVGWQAGLYTGFLVALSSTALVTKLLMDRRETDSERGRASVGILIFQDLAVVAMVLLVPMLGGEGGPSWGLAWALAKAVGIVVLVLLAARRVMPRVLEAVARTCSQEIFLLTVVAICFGTAWLTSLAGVSLSLGAFLAGLVVSESRFSEMAIGEIMPLQILFSATFFVSVGLLLDLRFLIARPLLILAAVGGVLAIKVLTTGASLKLLGYAAGTAASTGLVLAQIGEFSFVLERAGSSVGLFPGGLEEGGPQVFIASTVVLMMATPFLARLGARLRGGVGASPSGEGLGPEGGTDAAMPLRDHVVIAGYGEAGRMLAPALEARGIPYLILTLSPAGAREAEGGSLRVLRGNYTRRHELTKGGVRTARLLVVADDDPETTRRVASAARALNPDLLVVARTRFGSEVPALRAAGATTVVAEDRESVVRLLAEVLAAYEVDAQTIARQQEALRSAGGPGGDAASGLMATTVRLTPRQRRSERCAHAGRTGAVRPSAPGCEECLRLGDDWVHLRLCMTCGHVGCCDESKNRHATGHHGATGHPIVRSLEPGEDWAWCYADETML